MGQEEKNLLKDFCNSHVHWGCRLGAGCREREGMAILTEVPFYPFFCPIGLTRRLLRDATACPVPMRNLGITMRSLQSCPGAHCLLVSHCLLIPFLLAQAYKDSPIPRPVLQSSGETSQAQECLKIERTSRLGCC
jgi:hypothetical protein